MGGRHRRGGSPCFLRCCFLLLLMKRMRSATKSKKKTPPPQMPMMRGTSSPFSARGKRGDGGAVLAEGPPLLRPRTPASRVKQMMELKKRNCSASQRPSSGRVAEGVCPQRRPEEVPSWAGPPDPSCAGGTARAPRKEATAEVQI